MNFGNKPTTVKSVMSAFTKTIESLKQVEKQNREESARQRNIAAQAQGKSERALKEAQQASVIAIKLTELTKGS